MIADDLRAALPEMQRQAESMMITPCTISRDGEPVLDEDTGNYTPSHTVIFSGLCKIQTKDTEVNVAVGGSAEMVLQRYEIHVPVTSGPFQDKDVVTTPGRTFHVQGVHLKSWQTAQRLPVVEVV